MASIGSRASANILGKQVVLPATTTANQAYSYAFSTANTNQIGSVTVTKRTTKDPNGQVWVMMAPQVA